MKGTKTTMIEQSLFNCANLNFYKIHMKKHINYGAQLLKGL